MVTIVNVKIGNKLDDSTYVFTCVFDVKNNDCVNYLIEMVEYSIKLNINEFIIDFHIPEIIDLSTQSEYTENIKTVISNKLIN